MSKQETPKAGNEKVVGEKVHRNDIYGDIENKDADAAPPAIPAATVVLLREGADNDSVEVLMLQKNKKLQTKRSRRKKMNIFLILSKMKKLVRKLKIFLKEFPK